jgi:hypothetical protein
MLARFEQAVLLSICLANKGSLSSHVPKPYFMKKFQRTGGMQKLADRALHSLISLGYVNVHPTRGECRDLKEKGLTVSSILTPE